MQQANESHKEFDDFFEEPADEGQSVDFLRYLRGILKRWWIVLGFLMVGGLVGFHQVRRQKPVYEAEAWISFDNIQGAIADQLVQSRIAKLRSRSFAEEAAANLGLTLKNIQTPSKNSISREDVFSFFSTSRNPIGGRYQIRFMESKNCHFYLNNELIESRSLQSCTEDTVSINGLSFIINPDIVKDQESVDFMIDDFQAAVRSLIGHTKIRPTTDGSLMKIVLQGQNAKIAAKTVNMLAELFVKKSDELRRDATRFNREYLEEQLQLVKNDLDRSDTELKSFRSIYLQGLDAETQGTVNQLNLLQTQVHEVNFKINELSSLLNKLDPNHPTFDQNIPLAFVYREIGSHPVFSLESEMRLDHEGLRNLTAQRNALLARGLPERNPNVLELSEKIFIAEENIRERATTKVEALKVTLGELNKKIDEKQSKLDILPEEEVRFYRLNRERRANERLYENLLNRLKGAEITEAIPMERVSIMDPAVPSFMPVNPKNQLLIFWTMGSLVLGLGLAMILEMADRSVKSRDDVSHYLRLKILGSIPRVKFDSYELQDSEKAKSISSQIVTHDYSPTPVGESYRALRTSLLFSKTIGSIRTLVVSSAAPGEGKSFTAANLTITMAQQKSKTLLVDADLRRGVLHNTFNCRKKPGLTNYLTGVASLEEVLQETYIPNLSLIACGSLIPNPSELLGSDRMQKFVAGISQRFDMVVFDSPPLLAASDAVILGTLVNGVALVIRSGQTPRDTIKRKLELFQNVQARVLGVILNCAGVEVAHEGYSYYSY